MRTLPATALLALAALAAGCVTQDYLGKDYPPTDYVEVFFTEGDIEREYEDMGRDRAEAPDSLTSQQIVQEIVEEAKRHGADAVLIENIEIQQVGSTTNTFGENETAAAMYATKDGKLHTRHEPTGKYHETSYQTAVRNKVVTARFLKYRD